MIRRFHSLSCLFQVVALFFQLTQHVVPSMSLLFFYVCLKFLWLTRALLYFVFTYILQYMRAFSCVVLEPIRYVNNVITAPGDASFWRINAQNDGFFAKVKAAKETQNSPLSARGMAGYCRPCQQSRIFRCRGTHELSAFCALHNLSLSVQP